MGEPGAGPADALVTGEATGARAGMVGIKVFLGIMLGIFFHMMNSLFAHIGLLQNWPPLSAAMVPSAAFLAAAITMMWWVERR